MREMETKEIIRNQFVKFAENPEDVKKADLNLSATYLYFSLGIRALERAEDIFKKYHFNTHEIKQKLTAIEKNFDGVHTLFYQSISKDKRKQFAEDYMRLGEIIDKIVFGNESVNGGENNGNN